MTAVMLATYPELFAGGAVIAGLPYGTAKSVPAALERMRGQGLPDQWELSQFVRQAVPRAKTWPTLSVWHGSADATVVPSNGEALVDQWRGLHDLPAAPSVTERVDGQVRRVWNDADGRPVVKHIAVAGLGHGTPLNSRDPHSDEHPGPHMLEAGISSTQHMLDDWGLLGEPMRRSAPAKAVVPAVPHAMPRLLKASRPRPVRAADPITRTIETALRKAGLMR